MARIIKTEYQAECGICKKTFVGAHKHRVLMQATRCEERGTSGLGFAFAVGDDVLFDDDIASLCTERQRPNTPAKVIQGLYAQNTHALLYDLSYTNCAGDTDTTIRPAEKVYKLLSGVVSTETVKRKNKL